MQRDSSGSSLAISGTTTISASGQDITLDEAASTFGTLALTGANVAVTENAATDLGASTVSGTLGITSTGAVTHLAAAITDSGTLVFSDYRPSSNFGGTLAITTATYTAGTDDAITLDDAGNASQWKCNLHN